MNIEIEPSPTVRLHMIIYGSWGEQGTILRYINTINTNDSVSSNDVDVDVSDSSSGNRVSISIVNFTRPIKTQDTLVLREEIVCSANSYPKITDNTTLNKMGDRDGASMAVTYEEDNDKALFSWQ
ncbi:MAG: hypothetical protein ACRD47_13040 [Nitrososphaeraceae archaeon]